MKQCVACLLLFVSLLFLMQDEQKRNKTDITAFLENIKQIIKRIQNTVYKKGGKNLTRDAKRAIRKFKTKKHLLQKLALPNVNQQKHRPIQIKNENTIKANEKKNSKDTPSVIGNPEIDSKIANFNSQLSTIFKEKRDPFDFIMPFQSFLNKRNIRKKMPDDKLPNTNKKNQNNPGDDFQIVYKEYLEHLSYPVYLFWSTFKSLFIDDPEIFKKLKADKQLCGMVNDATQNNIINLTPFSNYISSEFLSSLIYLYSPLSMVPSDLPGQLSNKYYLFDETLKEVSCEELIFDNANMCKNLVLINSFGRCHQLPSDFIVYPVTKQEDMVVIMNKLYKFTKIYLKFAKNIFKKQMITIYFKLKEKNLKSPKGKEIDPIRAILYDSLIQPLLSEIANYNIDSIYTNLHCSIVGIDKYFITLKNNFEILKKIKEDLDKYKNEDKVLFNDLLVKHMNELLSLNKVFREWKIQLYELLYENIDITNKNIWCAVSVLKFLKQKIPILKIDMLEFIMLRKHPLTQLFLIASIDNNTIEFGNWLIQNDPITKATHIDWLLRYDISLTALFLLYNAKKCTGYESTSNLKKFLKSELFYTNEEAVTSVECLFKNRGNIAMCNKNGGYDWIVALAKKHGIDNVSFETVEQLATKLNNMRLPEVIPEIKPCCQEGICNINQECNNIGVKDFCRKCDEIPSGEECNTIYNTNIQNTIITCCNKGALQDTLQQKNNPAEFDRCKLTYGAMGDFYYWVAMAEDCHKCYEVSNILGRDTRSIIKYILQDSTGNFDQGKSFCFNPLKKLEEVCCEKLNKCTICSDSLWDDKYCKEVVQGIETRKLYLKYLEENTDRKFIEYFLRKRSEFYEGKIGLEEGCNSLK